MADEFAARYAGLLTGSYDCVDRIVLNAYFRLGNSPGGFRTWWRWLTGGSDAEADAVLDNTHLMRLAGRFARRVRAWAADNAVPVIDCPAGERKHLIAEEYLQTHTVTVGVFMILVARAPAMVQATSSRNGYLPAGRQRRTRIPKDQYLAGTCCRNNRSLPWRAGITLVCSAQQICWDSQQTNTTLLTTNVTSLQPGL